MNKNDILLKLFEIQAIKFGSFTLKSGMLSPIYLDMRLIISYPDLIKKIAEAFWKQIKPLSYDLICGVPYGAIPLATCLSLGHDIPMILQRKEKKEYGTKKQVEGVFQEGQTCVLIEDIITSGASLLETIASLKEVKLQVKDVFVIIDREQGGTKILEKAGVHVHSLFTLSGLLEILLENRKISAETQKSVLQFLRETQVATK